MAEKKAPPALKVGDMVKIHHFGIPRGRIVEVWGPLMAGKQVYRVIVRRKPKPMYIDLTEDQIELIPPEA
jgi:hypothetical protein